MTTSANDISVVLSGGSSNIDPNASLGGDPSSAPISSGSLNNLFGDLSSDDTNDGKEDYRCVYIFNDGDTPVYEMQVWLSNEVENGASIELGIEERDEIQRLTISGGNVTGGSLELSYRNISFVTEYNSDLGDWATDLQDALNSLTSGDSALLEDVSVVAQNNGSTLIFDITFSGIDGNRDHERITVVNNELTPSGTIQAEVAATQEGAPIDTIAGEINVETTPPGGVNFFSPTSQSPISIPRLEPNEGFPLWVKRVVESGTEAVEDDGFTLTIRAESLKP